jgi:putative heme-binding domain-containing protein
MRELLSDASAPLPARQQALRTLVRGRDAQAAPALIAALDQPQLQGEAIRALASHDHPTTASELLGRYQSFDQAARRDAISTLTARRSYALALLEAIESETVARSDVHAYHVRQMQSFDEPQIIERLQAVWGTVRESSADKKQKMEQFKRRLTTDRLVKADLSHGRVLFNKTCAACHRLFGEGHEIGPDITGSNRANLDYILENSIDPSSVVSQDYRMSTLALVDGRVVTGLIQNETDSAYTVRTVNDVTVIAKSDVEERSLSSLSLMPEGQLEQLHHDEVRDLVAYLASPSQVPLPRIAPKIDQSTGKVAGAIEGESIKVLGKTDGAASSQGMDSFKADRWSGNHQLWWTGQKVGSQLDMEVTVEQDDVYLVEIVLTRARDYGVVELLLDGKSMGGAIDCYVADRVDTTGVLQLGPIPLSAGAHRLSARVVGKNPRSTGTRFGLDHLRFVGGK